MKKSLSIVTLLSIVMVFCNGCLIGGHSSVKREGTSVSENTFKQIEIGKTDSNWIKAVLGEPNEKVKISDNETLWKYAYKETKDSGGYVFLIFGGHNTTETKSNYYVQFKDDLVTRCWHD